MLPKGWRVGGKLVENKKEHCWDIFSVCQIEWDALGDGKVMWTVKQNLFEAFWSPSNPTHWILLPLSKFNALKQWKIHALSGGFQTQIRNIQGGSRRWIVFGSMDIDGRIAVLMQGDYSLPSLIIGDSGLDASLDYIRVETSYTCVYRIYIYIYVCVFFTFTDIYIYAAASVCIHEITCVGHIHTLHTHCASSFSTSALLFLQESCSYHCWRKGGRQYVR